MCSSSDLLHDLTLGRLTQQLAFQAFSAHRSILMVHHTLSSTGKADSEA